MCCFREGPTSEFCWWKIGGLKDTQYVIKYTTKLGLAAQKAPTSCDFHDSKQVVHTLILRESRQHGFAHNFTCGSYPRPVYR